MYGLRKVKFELLILHFCILSVEMAGAVLWALES